MFMKVPVVTASESKLRQTLRRYYRDIFPADREPLPVAASVFLGAFIGVLPTIGIAVPLTLLATAVFKLPKAPGVVASFIATPPTLFFFFYPLGYFAVGLPIVEPVAIDFDFLEVIGSMTLANVSEVGSKLWGGARDHVIAFFVGMSIVATVSAALCAIPTYVIMKRKHDAKPISSQ